MEAPSTVIPALEEMGRAIALAGEVVSRDDALEASRALVSAMNSLSQAQPFSRRDFDRIIDPYRRMAGSAFELSGEERRTYEAAIEEAAETVEFPDVAAQLPVWVTADFGEEQHPDDALARYVALASHHGERLFSELRPVGEGFMLADTAAVEAFLASISQSCEA